MYDKDNDIERIFNEEVRDKKRTGYGAYHMSGKRGSKGVKKLMFPYDFMSTKEKRAYRKGGLIVETNIYDALENVPSIEELEKMEVESAKKIIETARLKHTVKPLLKHWGLSQYHFYNQVLPKFGLGNPFPSSSKGKTPTNKSNKKTTTRNYNRKSINKPIENEVEQLNLVPKQPEQQIITYVPEKKQLGVTFSFNDEDLEADYIETRILGLMGAMDKAKKYNISFELTEIR